MQWCYILISYMLSINLRSEVYSIVKSTVKWSEVLTYVGGRDEKYNNNKKLKTLQLNYDFTDSW